jgi:hypothetical protein
MHYLGNRISLREDDHSGGSRELRRLRSGVRASWPMSLEAERNFRLRYEWSVGTLIKLSLRNVIAFGEVRYCMEVGDAFHFGGGSKRR